MSDYTFWPMPAPKSAAEIAYEAFSARAGLLCKWAGLLPAEREDWQAVANALEAHAHAATGASGLDAMLREVLLEVERATAKFPTWPTDALHALAVLGEEFGEATKAMLQLIYEPHKTSAAEVHKEVIQTAAMALRLAMSLERYEYRPCAQHRQGLAHSEEP